MNRLRDRLNNRNLSASDDHFVSSRVEDVINSYTNSLEGNQVPESFTTESIAPEQYANNDFPPIPDSDTPMADALNIDRLTAFQERRLGKTPSNQFSKAELLRQKLNASKVAEGSGGTKGIQVVKLSDGRFGFANKATNQVVGQSGRVIDNAKAFRETAKHKADAASAVAGAKIAAGVLEPVKSKNWRTLVDSSNKELISELKADKTNIANAKKGLALLKADGVAAHKVALNLLVKLTEGRATDEDRDFVLGYSGVASELIRKILKSTNKDEKSRLLDDATEAFNILIDHAEWQNRRLISQKATSISSTEDQLKDALKRMSGSSEGAVTLDESRQFARSARMKVLMKKMNKKR